MSRQIITLTDKNEAWLRYQVEETGEYKSYGGDNDDTDQSLWNKIFGGSNNRGGGSYGGSNNGNRDALL